MTYKTLPKNQFSKVIRKWMKAYDVAAPREEKNGLKYGIINDPEEAVLNHYENTTFPPKAFFLPQSERLFACRNGRYQMPEVADRPRLLLGVRPCDARAFWLLDHVFIAKGEEDIYWEKRREKSLVISFGCDAPCSTCFCTSVGGDPFDKQGSDVQITEMDGDYLFEAVSDKGARLIADMPDAPEAVEKKVRQLQKKSAANMPKQFESKGLRDHLYDIFEDDFWREISQSCLGCGVCTFLCPTCYCFDIVDEVQRSERVRNWDTCMFRVYSQEASGHNPRPTKTERTRQRVMHKFAYWVDAVKEFGCTGCGRCVVNCPVNIDIREIARAAQERKAAVEVGK